jgi:hypothetical protein
LVGEQQEEKPMQSDARRAGRLTPSLDEAERSAIAAEAFTEMPLAAIIAEQTVNPEMVVDWAFPGATAVGMSHWHPITVAE